ncbi:hypothetical protein ACOME3_005310 [Neoechinorhynchus agilis]
MIRLSARREGNFGQNSRIEQSAVHSLFLWDTEQIELTENLPSYREINRMKVKSIHRSYHNKLNTLRRSYSVPVVFGKLYCQKDISRSYTNVNIC